MKEVTYEEWLRNPTPRMMWVWNSTVECKVKRMVLHFTKRNSSRPVIALTSDNITTANYKHCAEIAKTRRMTRRELSRWLREKPTRECKSSSGNDSIILCYYNYVESIADEEIDNTILIREDDSDWREPLVEV